MSIMRTSSYALAIILVCLVFYFGTVLRDICLRSTWTKSSDCIMKFERYESSTFEKLWLDNVKSWQDDPCAKLPEQALQAEIWSTYATKNQDKPQSNPPSDEVFSRYIFRNTCSGSEMKVYIEPLALTNRHPHFCSGGRNDALLLDKSYMVLDWQLRTLATGNVYYFDLGASTYDQGLGGNSQKWIVENYAKRGINFSGIFAWEAYPLNAADVFRVLPPELHSKYRWYNFPVNATEGSPSNPWTMLAEVVKPSDFTVVKLDIDSPSIETPLAQQLIDNPSLLQLVDEFYFEHHVNLTPLAPWWGPVTGIYLEDTQKTFLALRKAGIRAHSWV
ncbi:uncharacterized protein LOC129601231 [Paramacrobiotus metropolitanus]|uniref:uncharacterized protein LOC129601231 n=1 Tax=Paramacrobiotus metropolitanus TaxID=2943436 RepID=UPI002445B480|nr:uncharacterized protein LOC129601231 [Paramacrobiotus metropolitanus]